jgi:hypothetical protein
MTAISPELRAVAEQGGPARHRSRWVVRVCEISKMLEDKSNRAGLVLRRAIYPKDLVARETDRKGEKRSVSLAEFVGAGGQGRTCRSSFVSCAETSNGAQ